MVTQTHLTEKETKALTTEKAQELLQTKEGKDLLLQTIDYYFSQETEEAGQITSLLIDIYQRATNTLDNILQEQLANAKELLDTTYFFVEDDTLTLEDKLSFYKKHFGNRKYYVVTEYTIPTLLKVLAKARENASTLDTLPHFYMATNNENSYFRRLSWKQIHFLTKKQKTLKYFQPKNLVYSRDTSNGYILLNKNQLHDILNALQELNIILQVTNYNFGTSEAHCRTFYVDTLRLEALLQIADRSLKDKNFTKKQLTMMKTKYNSFKTESTQADIFEYKAEEKYTKLSTLMKKCRAEDQATLDSFNLNRSSEEQLLPLRGRYTSLFMSFPSEEKALKMHKTIPVDTPNHRTREGYLNDAFGIGNWKEIDAMASILNLTRALRTKHFTRRSEGKDIYEDIFGEAFERDSNGDWTEKGQHTRLLTKTTLAFRELFGDSNANATVAWTNLQIQRMSKLSSTEKSKMEELILAMRFLGENYNTSKQSWILSFKQIYNRMHKNIIHYLNADEKDDDPTALKWLRRNIFIFESTIYHRTQLALEAQGLKVIRCFDAFYVNKDIFSSTIEDEIQKQLDTFIEQHRDELYTKDGRLRLD